MMKSVNTANDYYEAYRNAMYYGLGSAYDGVGNSRLSREIIDIEVIVPNKVVKVTFGDRREEKMICSKEDVFNLERCLYIAIAKHLYKEEYTIEGIEWKAFELSHQKEFVKIVKRALKFYEKKEKERAEEEVRIKEEQERIARKRAKREAYKARREEKRKEAAKEEQIEIQKEAYIRAMEAM